MPEKLQHFIDYDNAFMWCLLIMSIIATSFIIERLLKFRLWHIKVIFKQGVINNLKGNNRLAATSLCEDTPGPIAHLIGKIITNGHKKRHEIENAVEVDYLIQISLLEKHLKIILNIAHLAPLIGLLGTVWGLINIFDVLSLSDVTNIKQVSKYIVTALTTTALGLIIALFCYGFYNFFVSTVENIVQEMEITIAEVLDFLTATPVTDNKQSTNDDYK